jgi:hypothetical protein
MAGKRWVKKEEQFRKKTSTELRKITCQMRTSEGGRQSSGKRMTVTMRVTGPLATPP